MSSCREVVGNLTELESEVRVHLSYTTRQSLCYCLENKSRLCLCLVQDIQIDALLIRACDPIIQAHCHVSAHTRTHSAFHIQSNWLFSYLIISICLQDVADNQIDTGDLMECLVQNKNQKEMNDKCAVGVTHFQLVSYQKSSSLVASK